MYLLIAYLVINIVISILLEKSKYKLHVATVVHAAAFVVVFVILLLFSPEFIDGVLANILSQDTVDALYRVISNDSAELIGVIEIVGMIIPFLALVVSVILTVKAVRYVIIKIKADAVFHRPKHAVHTAHKSAFITNKIYRLNCVMNC